MQGKGVSERVRSFSAPVFLKAVRRLLAQLCIPEPQRYTLKAFRAGKATALAAAGRPIGAILQAEEWRSAAFLAYIDEQEVDQAQLFHQALVESECEDDM